MEDNNPTPTSQEMTHSVLSTALQAKHSIDKGTIEDAAHIINDFIWVLKESGLAKIDEESMNDAEMIERGMYAANLYLAACARVGQYETKRLNDVDLLTKCLEKSVDTETDQG